jgi:hypothetical protein
MLRWCEMLPIALTSADPWHVTSIAQRQQPKCKTCKYKLAKQYVPRKARIACPAFDSLQERSQPGSRCQPAPPATHTSSHTGAFRLQSTTRVCTEMGHHTASLPATARIEHAQNCSKTVHPSNQALRNTIKAARPIRDTQHAATGRARPFVSLCICELHQGCNQGGPALASTAFHPLPDSTGAATGAAHPRLPLNLVQQNDRPGHLISRAPGAGRWLQRAAPQAPACLWLRRHTGPSSACALGGAREASLITQLDVKAHVLLPHSTIHADPMHTCFKAQESPRGGAHACSAGRHF